MSEKRSANTPPQRSREEQVHDAGVERHGPAWFEANMAAVSAANGNGLRAEQNKEAIATIVLRVLDVAKRIYSPQALASESAEHKHGCPALGGYGTADRACICGATPSAGPEALPSATDAVRYPCGICGKPSDGHSHTIQAMASAVTMPSGYHFTAAPPEVASPSGRSTVSSEPSFDKYDEAERARLRAVLRNDLTEYFTEFERAGYLPEDGADAVLEIIDASLQAARNTPSARRQKDDDALTDVLADLRPVPLSECLRVLVAVRGAHLSPSEKRELADAASLLELAYPALRELCYRIEACGASPELTHAVTLCSDLRQAVGDRWNPRDKHAEERVRKALPEVKP